MSFTLAPVDGGECVLTDPSDSESILAGPFSTTDGVATFAGLQDPPGRVQVICQGGIYEDEATANAYNADVTRAFATIDALPFSVSVTPLTEIAVRVAEVFSLDPDQSYDALVRNVALSLGMGAVDVTNITPHNLNVLEADGTLEGRYSVVLAALSQLQFDAFGEDLDGLDQTLELLVFGLANNGLFTKDTVQGQYFDALENLFDNPLIEPNLGADEDLDVLFHEVGFAPLASQVEYVDVDHPLESVAEPFSTINAGEEAVFDIIGTHLFLGMSVTLNGERCRTRDLQPLIEFSREVEFDLMFAECPAQSVGESELVIRDGDRVEFESAITVIDPVEMRQAIRKQSPIVTASSPGGGSSFVFGFISAEAPGIDATVGPAHDYAPAALEVFNVAGVVVELQAENGNVLQTTTSESDGYYEFGGVAENLPVRVVAKAQLKQARTTPGVGPEFNFTVRDNTSEGSPRRLYQLASSLVTTLAEPEGENQIDLRAKVGFDAQGRSLGNEQRQSAPFAILRVVKSATDKLQAFDPNITLPPLVLYWSGDNAGVSGDKSLGQIGTSHFDKSGLAPGVYILGKADSDTDEFDQGVIGHEFGHYLQARLSYSDSPGDSHSFGDFKDASLAYGEGYGTAVGGLLSSSATPHIYCDVSGPRQSEGSCNDLSKGVEAGGTNGFYSEATILHLMYQIGSLQGKGFAEFFSAVSKQKTAPHSSTIFSFLHHYLASNPDVSNEVQVLMMNNNIKTADPYGKLDQGVAADSAISATENQGDATVGATDLETLYIDLAFPQSQQPANSAAPLNLTGSSASFCFNHNLPGANASNGLGMLRRFRFTANYSGSLLLRTVDSNGRTISSQSTFYTVRDQSGAELSVFGYDGVDSNEYWGLIEVTAGTEYSVLVQVDNPKSILDGSRCGYQAAFARAPAGF